MQPLSRGCGSTNVAETVNNSALSSDAWRVSCHRCHVAEGWVDSANPGGRTCTRHDVPVALSAHRNRMPSWTDNAWFYRADNRTEFDKICLPLRCHLRRYVKGRFTAHAVPGGHLTMLEQASVQDLARTVRTTMACRVGSAGLNRSSQHMSSNPF